MRLEVLDDLVQRPVIISYYACLKWFDLSFFFFFFFEGGMMGRWGEWNRCQEIIFRHLFRQMTLEELT